MECRLIIPRYSGKVNPTSKDLKLYLIDCFDDWVGENSVVLEKGHRQLIFYFSKERKEIKIKWKDRVSEFYSLSPIPTNRIYESFTQNFEIHGYTLHPAKFYIKRKLALQVAIDFLTKNKRSDKIKWLDAEFINDSSSEYNIILFLGKEKYGHYELTKKEIKKLHSAIEKKKDVSILYHKDGINIKLEFEYWKKMGEYFPKYSYSYRKWNTEDYIFYTIDELKGKQRISAKKNGYYKEAFKSFFIAPEKVHQCIDEFCADSKMPKCINWINAWDMPFRKLEEDKKNGWMFNYYTKGKKIVDWTKGGLILKEDNREISFIGMQMLENQVFHLDPSINNTFEFSFENQEYPKLKLLYYFPKYHISGNIKSNIMLEWVDESGIYYSFNRKKSNKIFEIESLSAPFFKSAHFFISKKKVWSVIKKLLKDGKKSKEIKWIKKSDNPLGLGESNYSYLIKTRKKIEGYLNIDKNIIGSLRKKIYKHKSLSIIHQEESMRTEISFEYWGKSQKYKLVCTEADVVDGSSGHWQEFYLDTESESEIIYEKRKQYFDCQNGVEVYYDRLYDKYLLDSAKTSDVLEYFLIHKEKHPDFNWTTLGDMDHLPSRDDDEYYFLPSEEDDELPF